MTDHPPAMRRLTAEQSPLAAALDAIVEPLACAGVCTPDAPLALVLPGGDDIVVDLADPAATVERLIAHAEPAPFGDRERTRLDPAVRRALRLRDRERVRLRGFDPAAVMGSDGELTNEPQFEVLREPAGALVVRGRDKDTPWQELARVSLPASTRVQPQTPP